MPSASSKSEKPASTEAVDPLKQAIVIIGHKIRNLEKRKSKLDSYKESIDSLTKEQVEAVAKYDEVIQQLELSKEYVKQFKVISTESDKLKKKQAKKDAQDKYVAEVNKIKQVLEIQDVLQNMGTEIARQDFLKGQNGAVQLTETDLKALDDLYIEVSPKRFSEDGSPLENDQFQKAAECFLAIVDGKAKEVAGLTGAKLKELIATIHTSGYFEKPPIEERNVSAKNAEIAEDEEDFAECKEILSNVIVPTQTSTEGSHPPVQNPGPVQTIMSGGPIMPGAQPPMMQPNQHPILPPNVPNIVPTPVSQVESSFFNAQGFKPPTAPNAPPSNHSARQINDVIQNVAGKFNFLQESELDIGDLNSVVISGNPTMAAPQMPGATPIPTQTFTNQNFNSQPGNVPAYPPNYPPQPPTFQPFVPAFPAFVPQNASAVPNANTNPNAANPSTVVSVNNSVNQSIPNSSSSINVSSNKCNNIPNSIPAVTNRNANVNFTQSQHQISSNYPNQANKQTLPQVVSQAVFPHSNINVGSGESKKIEDMGRVENEVKEKQENEKQDWCQTESTNWADDWTETTEWNPSQSDGNTNTNKYSSGRPNRNAGGMSRNTNGYQGNRSRTNRSGGYRDSQNSQGSGSNYYQNQNGYQQRNDRTNEYSIGKGSDLRENNFKERGDYNNRERDSYGGGFKRGPSNRGPNVKGSVDRSDKSQMQIPRSNTGGLRVSRNINTRQPGGGGRGGNGFQRQPPNPATSGPPK